MKDIVLAIIGSGALSALISGLITSIHDKKESKKEIEKALQLLLLGEIKREGKEFLHDGKISSEDLQAFNEVYSTYKLLDGNGYAESIRNKVNQLPLDIE